MKYPDILPGPNYKKIDCDCSNLYLIRSTNADTKGDLIDPETNKIYIKYICHPSDNIIDLSTSLLGIFKEEFFRIEFSKSGKEKFNILCNPDENVSTPVYNIDYEISNHKICFFIKIADLRDEFVAYEKEAVSYLAKCLVVHTPMRWNYWHFSIRWDSHEGIIPYEKKILNKNWVQRLKSSCRIMLSQYAILNIEEYDSLPEECYLKTSKLANYS